MNVQSRRSNVAGEAGVTGQARDASDWIAPDCHGENFYELAPVFRGILKSYMAPDLHAHMEPHLRHLGDVACGKLDELLRHADIHQPVLHRRDRFGRHVGWIECHPADKEVERMACEDFALNRMCHQPGAFGWPAM